MTCLGVRLPPALLLANTKQPSGGTGRHAILRRSCPQRRASSTLALATFHKQHCRCDRCPTDRHEVGVLGSIPRPATWCKQRRGWASAQPGLISQDRRVRPPDPLLSVVFRSAKVTGLNATFAERKATMVEYANRQSGKHERLVIL